VVGSGKTLTVLCYSSDLFEAKHKNHDSDNTELYPLWQQVPQEKWHQRMQHILEIV